MGLGLLKYHLWLWSYFSSHLWPPPSCQSCHWKVFAYWHNRLNPSWKATNHGCMPISSHKVFHKVLFPTMGTHLPCYTALRHNATPTLTRHGTTKLTMRSKACISPLIKPPAQTNIHTNCSQTHYYFTCGMVDTNWIMLWLCFFVHYSLNLRCS